MRIGRLKRYCHVRDAQFVSLTIENTHRTFITVLSPVHSGSVTYTGTALAGAITITKHLKQRQKLRDLPID